jgi:hypothetical protein
LGNIEAFKFANQSTVTVRMFGALGTGPVKWQVPAHAEPA